MKIIGTGLSGLVGSRIVELLSPKHQFIDLSLEKGVDITNFNQLKSVYEKQKPPDFMLHLAAFTDVNAAHLQDGNEKGLCYRVNVIGTNNLVSLCGATGTHFIHVSTDFIFKGDKGGKENPYAEKDKAEPIEWYGKTKLKAEEEVRRAVCPWTILRLAFPFKAKPSSSERTPPKLDLVRKIKTNLEQGKEFDVFTDQIITPTFIDDFVEIIDKVIKTKKIGIFNAVGSSFVSPFELAQKIAQVFDLPQEIIKPSLLVDFMKTSQRPRQQFMALSNKKAKDELGVSPKTIDKALEVMKLQLSS